MNDPLHIREPQAQHFSLMVVYSESMPKVPDDFCDEFDAKGETFFEIAEVLYTNHDRQYTQDELAEMMGRSNKTISKHTGEMVTKEWLNRNDGQTTYAWNTAAHDPAATENITAARSFYSDLWTLLKEHTETTPGIFAVLGSVLFITAIVVFAFFIGFSLSITQQSAVPTVFYLAVAAGSFITGIIVTLLSPFQAIVNRLLWSWLPDGVFQNKK